MPGWRWGQEGKWGMSKVMMLAYLVGREVERLRQHPHCDNCFPWEKEVEIRSLKKEAASQNSRKKLDTIIFWQLQEISCSIRSLSGPISASLSLTITSLNGIYGDHPGSYLAIFAIALFLVSIRLLTF